MRSELLRTEISRAQHSKLPLLCEEQRRASLPVHQNKPISSRSELLSTQFCASDLEIQPCTPDIADFSALRKARQSYAERRQALVQQIRKIGLMARPLSAYCLQRHELRRPANGYGYAPLAEIERLWPTWLSPFSLKTHP
jgi:hypothetical protein